MTLIADDPTVRCILEQNEFEKTYSDCMWQKLKTGTGVYKVYWDADKLGGLGDIAIERVDLLNVFWEPGVRDIQDSRYFFHTSLEDNDELERQYPQLQGRLRGNAFMATKFVYDDSVPTDGKSTVIDVYYKKYSGGKKVLHYCKYVGDTLLYSTENTAQSMAGSEEMAQALPGLYEHGLYPFVFDSLFPVEGSPCGYGFIDLCQNSQTQIDMMQTAFVKNTMLGATPRYFQRMDGAINEEEFLNLANPVIHVSGNLGEDSIRTVDYRPLEFEGKDELMQRLAYNGTMQRQLAMYQQYALALTQKYEPDKAGALMESITGRAAPGGKTAKKAAKLKGKESGRMERARSSAYNAALPGGGR